MNRRLFGRFRRLAVVSPIFAGVRQSRQDLAGSRTPLRPGVGNVPALYPGDHHGGAYGPPQPCLRLEGGGDRPGPCALPRGAGDLSTYLPARPPARELSLRQSGRALLIARGDLGAAEPLVLERYQRLMERQATTPPQSKERTIQAIEGIVQLYEAKATARRLRAWRTRLERRARSRTRPVPPL